MEYNLDFFLIGYNIEKRAGDKANSLGLNTEALKTPTVNYHAQSFDAGNVKWPSWNTKPKGDLGWNRGLGQMNKTAWFDAYGSAWNPTNWIPKMMHNKGVREGTDYTKPKHLQPKKPAFSELMGQASTLVGDASTAIRAGYKEYRNMRGDSPTLMGGVKKNVDKYIAGHKKQLITDLDQAATRATTKAMKRVAPWAAAMTGLPMLTTLFTSMGRGKSNNAAQYNNHPMRQQNMRAQHNNRYRYRDLPGY